MKKDERLNFSDRTPSVRRLVVSLVLMLLAVLPAAAQNKKITVDLDNVPVREFIKTVESQSGYTFAYNNSEIDLTYNRENETYNFLKRNVQFSLFFHPIKAKAFNHHLSGN